MLRRVRAKELVQPVGVPRLPEDPARLGEQRETRQPVVIPRQIGEVVGRQLFDQAARLGVAPVLGVEPGQKEAPVGNGGIALDFCREVIRDLRESSLLPPQRRELAHVVCCGA